MDHSILSFFFSSRRRHTRFDCDWSSDVCSSDLTGVYPFPYARDSARSFPGRARSEEHTSELQSQSNLVCRLLLEKKKKKYKQPTIVEKKKNQEIITQTISLQ